MNTARTYLDHNASSPLRPEARAAMLAALDTAGNRLRAAVVPPVVAYLIARGADGYQLGEMAIGDQGVSHGRGLGRGQQAAPGADADHACQSLTRRNAWKLKGCRIRLTPRAIHLR